MIPTLAPPAQITGQINTPTPRPGLTPKPISMYVITHKPISMYAITHKPISMYVITHKPISMYVIRKWKTLSQSDIKKIKNRQILTF